MFASACAQQQDAIQELTERDRAQGEELAQLERRVLELQEFNARLQRLEREVAALRGITTNLTEQNRNLSQEQQGFGQELERSLSGQSRLERLLGAERERLGRERVAAGNTVDKVRGRLDVLERLLRSPIAGLPSTSRADKDFRQAFYRLVNGELDLAATDFARFTQVYPQHGRITEAYFRQGQALFLLRRHEQALEPFFVVVDKHPKHPLVPNTRWLLARSLEETGELLLARDFYTQLINAKGRFTGDATRRLAYIDKLYGKKPAQP